MKFVLLDILFSSIILFLIPYSVSVKLNVISIENPIQNSRHCEKVQLHQGKIYKPLIDHLLEDGCKHPVRQSQLEKDFYEVLNKNDTNGRIKEIVENGLIDWTDFKRNLLEIPEEFSQVDGFSFVEEITPMCLNEESLMLRICFAKNSNRKFGIPEVFETADGALYQFAIGDEFLSTSSCFIEGTFGRCTAKPSSIVFKTQNQFRKSSVSSSSVSQPSSMYNVMIGASILVIVFLSIGSVTWYKRQKRKNETANENQQSACQNPLKTSPIRIEIPFIDDAICFDI